MSNKTARRGVLNACVWLGLALCGSAQAQTFRVGERVQASPTSMQSDWRDCSVIEVHDLVPKKAYSVRCDPAPGSSTASTFLVNQDWVRGPRAGAATAAGPANTASAPRPATVATTPPNASAPTRVAPGGAQCTIDDDAASAEPERSIRAVIRAGFERPAAPGADGAVSVHIENLSIGAARAYTPYRDPIEADGRQVYPVRAKFTACTDYRTRLVLVTRERLYACYRDETNAWACDITAAANTNVRDTTQNVAK